MKVFISWSGELSGRVALLFQSWIGDVLQGVETWISKNDLEKGSMWIGDISTQLSKTGIGVLCLTRDNLGAPWILFEAGALSKGIPGGRICPLLIDIGHADVTPPLSQFNGTLPNKADVLKLVLTVNAQQGESSLSSPKVEKAFERWWPDFETKFREIVLDQPASQVVIERSLREIAEETLEICRSLQNQKYRLDVVSAREYRPPPPAESSLSELDRALREIDAERDRELKQQFINAASNSKRPQK
jgi:hypothetical protein